MPNLSWYCPVHKLFIHFVEYVNVFPFCKLKERASLVLLGRFVSIEVIFSMLNPGQPIYCDLFAKDL